MEIEAVNIKAEARQWINGYEWHVAGTLTYKKGTTKQQAERIMRSFWGRANQAIYGNAWRRYDKKIENITIYDTNADGENPHYHITIRMPADRYNDIEAFSEFLRESWREVCGPNFVSEFEAIEDKEAWVDYITRKLGKYDCDNLHTHSSHIAAKRSQTD